MATHPAMAGVVDTAGDVVRPVRGERDAADRADWHGVVLRDAAEVRGRLNAVPAGDAEETAAATRTATHHLEVAERLAATTCSFGWRVFFWFTLQGQEDDELAYQASRSLTVADAEVLRVEPAASALLRAERIGAGLDDLRVPTKVRAEATRVLRDFVETPGAVQGKRREVSREVLRLGDEAASTQKHWADFNSRLFGVSMWLIVGLLAICIITTIVPGFLPLCASGKPGGTWCGAGNTPMRGEVFEVAVVGALGGLLSTVMALSRHPSTAVPDFVRATESGLRVPLGALVAILGVLLLQSGLAQGAVTQFQPRNDAVGVLVWAAIFGFASILFAKLVDRRLTNLAAELDQPRSARAKPATQTDDGG